MSAAELRDALARIGIDCEVEARDALALLVPRDAAAVIEPRVRREIGALARTHGFSHVAVEVPGD